MFTTFKTMLSAAVLAAMTATSAHAALVSLGDGTVKDTNTNLIWLQDWNVNGQQNWSTQKAWAEGLDFAGSNEWRLPEKSEYEALFGAYGDLTAVTNFTDVQSPYWSGTEWAPAFEAWYFIPQIGAALVDLEWSQFHAVAVRAGDVTASVPEPQTLALALLALGATALTTRHRGTRLQRCASAA